jgi:hypothetical protein
MDRTQQSSGGIDIFNKEHVAAKPGAKKPAPVTPPPAGQKLLTEEEKRKFKDLKSKVNIPPGIEPDETDSPEATARTNEKSGGGLSSLLEGNNKYIVIAVALVAVYFLFIKKR